MFRFVKNLHYILQTSDRPVWPARVMLPYERKSEIINGLRSNWCCVTQGTIANKLLPLKQYQTCVQLYANLWCDPIRPKSKSAATTHYFRI